MITLSETFTFLYFISIFLFLNSLSNFFFWVLLELNMVLFICFLFYSSSHSRKMELYDFSLFYFIVQSLGSMIFLYSSFFSCSFTSNSFSTLILLSLLLKSALFPFSFWLYNSIGLLSSESVSYLLSVQKIPVFSFLFSIHSPMLLFFLLLSFIFGSFMLMGSTFWFNLLLSSSIYSSLWIFFLYSMSNLLFVHFFLLYTFYLFFFSKAYSLNFICKPMDSLYHSLVFMFFMGLPPVSAFFFKFYFVNFFLSNFGLLLFFLVFFCIFFSLFGYFKFLFEFFLPLKSTYSSFSFSTFSPAFLFMGLGVFPQVFIFSGKLY